MRAIQITEFGGPEVLRLVDLPDPVPADGRGLLRVTSAGVNFADSLQAEDAYLAPRTCRWCRARRSSAPIPTGGASSR